MPKLAPGSVPKYRKHKASGQAVVTIAGKDNYLGPWRSTASRVEYDRLIGEWLASGRPTTAVDPASQITVTEVIAAYWRFAKGYYVKQGQPTSMQDNIRRTLKLLQQRYGRTPACQFGPLALKAIQHHLIDQGLSRRTINDVTETIRRVFKWAVSEELVPPFVYHGLKSVSGLRKGRTKARETSPVLPVSDETLELTIPHMTTVVADMIQVQRLTGCRPGEVCMMRPIDINTELEIWEFRPPEHKTAHHERDRVVLIGPRAQAILRPYLDRNADCYCFSPKESEQIRRAKMHANRMTPLSCGNRPGTNRRKRPRHQPGKRYDASSYRTAVHRACDIAFPPPPPLARRADETEKQWKNRLTARQHEELKTWQSEHRWSPNRIRHAAATEIRRQFGLEAAQVTLGHAKADVTQVYAERDLEKAKEVMRQVG